MNLKKGGKKRERKGKKKEIQERFHPLWEDLDEFGKGENEGKKVGRKETQERLYHSWEAQAKSLQQLGHRECCLAQPTLALIH